jgi:hypothetical protein
MARLKRSSSNSKQSPSPLDAKQQSLAAQEEKLRREMERLESMIKEAPQRAEALKRKRQEELMARTAYGNRGDSRPMSLVDKRYEANVGALPRRRRSLKSERRQERMKFLLLFVILVVVAIWLYSTLPS